MVRRCKVNAECLFMTLQLQLSMFLLHLWLNEEKPVQEITAKSMVNVLKFGTSVACQTGLNKQPRSSLIKASLFLFAILAYYFLNSSHISIISAKFGKIQQVV